MSAHPEPFITVAHTTLDVNGQVHDVSHTGGGSLRLTRPAELPAGEATLRRRTYEDDGRTLIDDVSRTILIVEPVDGSDTHYRADFTPVAEPVA